MYSPFQQRRQFFHALKEKRNKPPHQQPKPKGEALVYCAHCGKGILPQAFADSLSVCPHCSHHHPLSAPSRLGMLFDQGSARLVPINKKRLCFDPLKFEGYGEKLSALQQKTNLPDGVVSAVGKVNGFKAVVSVMDTRFLMGSMGAAVGEMLAQSIEYAHKSKLPLIIFCAGGGARMQEGAVSLMQMAKTGAAIKRFSNAGGLYIAVLTHPTMGGISASFAMLGDITLAEPNALIGFAGPRVIEQTIGETLPQGFQRAEYLLEHGFVDEVVPRHRIKDTLTQLLRLHTTQKGGQEKC